MKKSKASKIMSEFKRGTLHAGIDPKGPKKAPDAKSKAKAISARNAAKKGGK